MTKKKINGTTFIILNLIFGLNFMIPAKKSLYCVKHTTFNCPEGSANAILTSTNWEIEGEDFHIEKDFFFNEGNFVDGYFLQYTSRSGLFWITINYQNDTKGVFYDSIAPVKNIPPKPDTLFARHVRSRNQIDGIPDPYYLYQYKPLFSVEFLKLDTLNGLTYHFELDLNDGNNQSNLTVTYLGDGNEQIIDIHSDIAQKYYQWVLEDMTKMDSLSFPPFSLFPFENLDIQQEEMSIKPIDFERELTVLSKRDTWLSSKKPFKYFDKNFVLVEKDKKRAYRKYKDQYSDCAYEYWEFFSRR